MGTFIELGAFALVCCVGVSQSARAQSVSPPADKPKPSPKVADNPLGEIIVTAQRRSENLQSVPIAITALSGVQLEAAGVTSTSGLASVTPALTFSDSAGFVEPRIRGIGNSSAGPAVENAVATYVDGVYIASAPASLMSLNDVARVEILKGPQGTLFGRNATAGVVQVITKDPIDQFGGNAAFGIGNYATLQSDLYVTGPIAQELSADLSLSLTHQGDGYGRNIATGDDLYKTYHDVSARSKWLLHLGDQTKLRLSLDGSQRLSSDPTATQLSGTAPAAYKDSTGMPIIGNHSPWDGDSYYDARYKTTVGGVSLRLDRSVGALNISSITAYRVMNFQQMFDANNSPLPVPPLEETYTQKDHQLTQELQIGSGSGGRLRWIAGAYYFRLNSKYDPLLIGSGLPGAETYSEVLRDNLNTDSVSAYGQATFEILSDTNLTGGIRYTHESRTIDGTIGSITPAGVATMRNLVPGKVKANTPTWRISLDRRISDDALAYISYNRGYKSGGFSPASPTAPAYLPEYLDAYEIGVKSELLGRRLRVNAAAFLYSYRDIQVNTFVGTLAILYNAARARSYGLDVDAEFKINQSISLTGGMVLDHDRFTSFPLASTATPVGNGTVTIGPGSATGHRLPFAPDASITLGFDIKKAVAGGLANLVVSDLYSSGFYTQPDNYLHQRAYNWLNASLSWRPGGNRYSITVWAHNILDKAVAEQLLATATIMPSSYNPPRTVGVRVGANF